MRSNKWLNCEIYERLYKVAAKLWATLLDSAAEVNHHDRSAAVSPSYRKVSELLIMCFQRQRRRTMAEYVVRLRGTGWESGRSGNGKMRCRKREEERGRDILGQKSEGEIFVMTLQ